VFGLPGPLPRKGLAPLLDPGSPAQASLSIAPLPRERSPDLTRLRLPKVRLSFYVRPVLPDPIPEPRSFDLRSGNKSSGQSRPMFGGPSWDNPSRVPLRSPKFRGTPGAASRLRKIISSGASSRLAPKRTRKSPSIACRRRSVLLPPPRPFCRCRLRGRLGLPPRSLEDHAPSFRVAEAKFSVTSLWIMGISGTTIGTVAIHPLAGPIRFTEPLFGCRFVPLRLPRPSA
jgi:hypothetical protein